MQEDNCIFLFMIPCMILGWARVQRMDLKIVLFFGDPTFQAFKPHAGFRRAQALARTCTYL